MRRRCLTVMAIYVARAAGDTSPYQKIFERLVGGLVLRHKDSCEDFLDIVNLMLDAVDDQGIFKACPGFVSLAVGSTTLQRLLEVASRTEAPGHWIQAIRDAFNARANRRAAQVAEEFWPLRAELARLASAQEDLSQHVIGLHERRGALDAAVSASAPGHESVCWNWIDMVVVAACVCDQWIMPILPDAMPGHALVTFL